MNDLQKEIVDQLLERRGEIQKELDRLNEQFIKREFVEPETMNLLEYLLFNIDRLLEDFCQLTVNLPDL